MYKIRFNLSKGQNYQKWQIKTKDEKYYLDPENVTLVMEQCVLKNNKKIAKKIFEGQNKTVCAWVLCYKLSIKNKIKTNIEGKEIKYNPKKNPYWTDGSNNLDDKKFNKIISKNKYLFATNCQTGDAQI